MQKRFVSWAAVSSLPQAKKISLTEQREVNQRHIERHRGVLIAALEVPGESRDIDLFEEARDRIEAYAQLNELISAKAFDVLICLTRSRLGRTLALIETVAQLCRRAGIIIYETESPPSSLEVGESSDTDLLTGAVRSWSAQREVDELRRRQKMGMLGRFKKGHFLAAVPWGWKASYDERGNQSLYIDAIAAKTIRTALITLYCESGVGSQYICNELNARGMTTATGKPFTRKTASNIFRMIWRYAGYSEINRWGKGHHNKHNTGRPYARQKGNWPAIITEDELRRILSEMDARRGKRGVGNGMVYRYSLMVYCQRCQKRMTFSYQPRANGRRVVFATCEIDSHPRRNILEPNITPKLWEFFLMLKDPDNWVMFMRDEADDTAQLEVKSKAILAQIRKAEEALLRVDDKLIDGTFDEARHAHQVSRLREQIQQYHHELTILEDRRLVMERAAHRLDRIREIAEHGTEYLEMQDERAANALLRPLIRIWAQDNAVTRIEIL